MVRHLKNNGGFTLIEVMIALTVFTVGFLGIMALQIASIEGGMTSLDITVSTTLGEKFLETVKRESTDWNATADITNPSECPILSKVGASWQVYSESGRYRLNNEGQTTFNDPFARFCLHYRVVSVQTDEVVRVDVRVLWLRKGSNETLYPNCELTMASDLANAMFVNVSGLMSRWSQ